MGVRLKLFLCVTFLCCELLTSQTIYFAPSRLGDTPQSEAFTTSWYSKHLQAMNEPSLWEESKKPETHIYRFLWLRTFDHPVSVRVVIKDDGSAEVFTKIMSGQGGYEPGRLIKNTKRRLSKEYVEYGILQMLENARFWTLPTREEADPNMVHLDGAQWIMEGVRDGKYHVVDRWSPASGEYKAMCVRFLIDLGKLK